MNDARWTAVVGVVLPPVRFPGRWLRQIRQHPGMVQVHAVPAMVLPTLPLPLPLPLRGAAVAAVAPGDFGAAAVVGLCVCAATSDTS